ncbi:VWA domain-containing protein [Oceanithermus sp.]
MGLAHPWFLLALPLARRARGLDRLVIVLLVLGAAGPQLPLRLEKTAVVVDLSPSAGYAASREAAGLQVPGAFYIGFAERSARLRSPAERRTDLGRTTRPQRALEAAVAAGADRIVLVSDGLWLDRPVSPVPVYPVYVEPPPHVGISQVLAPAAPREGEVVEVRALLESTTRARATVTFAAGETRQTRELELAPGRSSLAFRFRLTGPTTVSVGVKSEYGEDRAEARLRPLEGGLALVVDDEAAARYLEAAGWKVRRGRPADLAGEPDLLVIGGPASSWTPEDLARLEGYLRLGGGVLWTAASRGLFFGGWQQTAIFEKIPLQPEPGRGAAVVLVLDVSGSMAGENPSKLRRAVDGARALVEAAGPEDTLGIVVFASDSRWLLAPRPMTYENKRLAEERLLSLTAGGGSQMEAAYAAALETLRNTDAPERWAIVVSDGQVAEDERRRLLELAAASTCCVRTIALALGANADAGFLERLAAAGGGEFYDLADPRALQQTLARLGREAFADRELSGSFPVVPQSHPVTRGLENPPPLAVLMPARARPWASAPLMSEDGRAVLALGAVESGRVAALATDLSRSWRGYEGASRLMANLARWLSNTPARPGYRWEDGAGGRTLHVYGRFDPLPLAHWEGKTVALEPTSPLSYRLRLPAGFDRPVRVSSGGRTVFVAEPPRGDEWPDVDGRQRLAELASSSGGRLAAGPPPAPRRLPEDVAPWLWALALALFLLERWREYAVG